MKRSPELYSISELDSYLQRLRRLHGRSIVLRPPQHERRAVMWRLKMAINVFIGKYDVLIW